MTYPAIKGTPKRWRFVKGHDKPKTNGSCGITFFFLINVDGENIWSLTGAQLFWGVSKFDAKMWLVPLEGISRAKIVDEVWVGVMASGSSELWVLGSPFFG